MEHRYNMRSPAVKRLMREAQELSQPTEEYSAQPLEDNLFEWHFTVRGPPDSDFDGGIYHGRIILPADYPMKPPSIILLTPNGRFETNKKICLSISGHHPESWQPSWSIRTALLAIIGFMPTSGKGAIGALDYTPKERKGLARRSQDWKCETCGFPKDLILGRTDNNDVSLEAKELAIQISFKGEENASEMGSESQEAVANGSVVNELPSETIDNNPERIGNGLAHAETVNSLTVDEFPPNETETRRHLHHSRPSKRKNVSPRKTDENDLQQHFHVATSPTVGRSCSTKVTICVIIALIIMLLLRRFFFF